jgi:hypothetical protein
VGDTVLFLTLMAQLYGPLNYFGGLTAEWPDPGLPSQYTASHHITFHFITSRHVTSQYLTSHCISSCFVSSEGKPTGTTKGKALLPIGYKLSKVARHARVFSVVGRCRRAGRMS